MIQTSQVHHCRECGSTLPRQEWVQPLRELTVPVPRVRGQQGVLPQRHSGECKARCCGPARSVLRCGDSAATFGISRKTIVVAKKNS